MQTDPITIGLARCSDLDEIACLSKIFIEQDLGWRYTPKRLQGLLRNRRTNLAVARHGDELAGFGIMTYREHSANLDLLAVKIEYRRMGVGSQIVQWLLCVARTAGIPYVYVQSRKRNTGAISFYERLGFLVIEEVPGYYGGKEAAVILSQGLWLDWRSRTDQRRDGESGL